ncbi:relaxase/mobilization nuclease domain-containing protein [Ruminococcus sp.]|uniref:relaxase/mobilization nuclease domain-containing protein n=1 Tax=Ruminococcus sp. TaxID=41978 RepID=UPI0025D61AB3|nr:relaxase/mobilization nuclease domain-containing protein [Ruminococcus sp.]MBQ6252486.1 relaxase/mobilization nuclease domain-containing protein [Ruminococcus sp.]
MAYIAQVSIRNSGHMENAIGYIAREEKAMKLNDMKKYLSERLNHVGQVNTASGERATFINCSDKDTYKDFEIMRKAFNQDKGVIAHHYYQSFQKDDNVTPEQAHQIGVELAKKMFPNFQVAIATHIDREHIHNHIIVNSCNIVTGQKWYSNKRTLSDIRKESDRLCLANGLGVITKNNKYQGLDRTTYQLGLKGKSWKINLVHDLDVAVEQCKSKEDFISFLRGKDYSVRYTDSHITITKNGEKKGIRVDTLARQFGDKYKKASLEKNMGYYTAPSQETVRPIQPKNVFHSSGKSYWEHYEQHLFKERHYLPSKQNNVVRDYEAERLVSYAERQLMYSRNIFEFIIKALVLLSLKAQRRKKNVYPVRYKRVQQLPVKPYITYGNISYRELRETSGDTYTIKVSMEKLLHLVNQPILYFAKINRDNSNSVTITVKEKDKDFLAELLKLKDKTKQLSEQSERINNQNTYRELKEAAVQSGTKLQYLMINEEQKKILEDNFIQFAFFDKDDKINIAFLPDKAELIKKLIYPKQEKKVTETPQQKNARIYAQLKRTAALNGEKLRFKAKLTKQQLEALSKTDVTFAYFVNNDDKSLYNIAYDKSNESKVKDTLAALNNQKLS